MSGENRAPDPVDPGLYVLVGLLRFHGIGADPQQIHHQLGVEHIGVAEMLRYAKQLGLKARAYKTGWERLAKTPLPGVAMTRNGSFLLLGGLRPGKDGELKALVQVPGAPQPSMMSRQEFETVWDGRILLIARRASLGDLTRRFDITWFLGAIRKYRRLFAEVLVASFFLQLFALVSPLFFQVVIDKVLVHRSMSTLEVLAIGLVAIGVFEAILGMLRTYVFAHTTNRVDVELGARLFHHLVGAANRLFPGASRRQFGGARARTREHPQFSHGFGADAGHRPVLHLRLPGGDVHLLPTAHFARARLVSVLYRDLCRYDAAIPPPARREVPPRRREPGVPGRERHRRGDPEGDGGRAADAAALGGAACRLRHRQLPRRQSRQHRQPVRAARQQAD